MPEKIRDARLPRGFTRALYRLPIWLYHVHLGWLLGKRCLLLTHTGRKSGLARQTVLEVLEYEKASGTCYVCAGWGEKSDWVLTVTKTPEVTITIGRRQFNACARRLSAEETEQKILAYARRYPIARRALPHMLGYRVDGTEEDFRALARLEIVFAFDPVSSRLS